MNLNCSCTSCPAPCPVITSRADKESCFNAYAPADHAFQHLRIPGEPARTVQSAKMATLHDEVTSSLTGAFGRLGTEPDDSGGISGDYLPLSVDRAPFSQSLIADDKKQTSSPRLSCLAARSCRRQASLPASPAVRPGIPGWVRPRCPALRSGWTSSPAPPARGRCAWFPDPTYQGFERRLWAYCGA